VKPYKFIISGGGTGGHIFPAIAIANELKQRYPDADFLFVGARDRMEMEKVPKAGYPIEGLWISGIQRNLTLSNLSFPLKLISSLHKARKIIKKFQPDVAVGTGGYASAPLLKVATMRNIPSLIQEQNSYAGITNKWLSNSVDKICVAYKGMEKFFPKEKILFTGNPVREDVISNTISQSEARIQLGLDPNKKTLLVLGGSLGSKRINELIASQVEFFKKEGLQVLWQCGKSYYNSYKGFQNEDIQVTDFLYAMNVAYSAADFIVSRSGALSVSELCLVGKPVVFIPSPNVAEDHQTKNAQAIIDQDAAIMIPEKEIDATFESKFKSLIHDISMQKKLGDNLKKLARPNATRMIVDEIEKLLKNKA